ncbi:hypothetical protein DERP_006914 [Dermatophagoides pteronyssinus]|uniref:TLD domain-containing protein 2-like n=1 Tax=Dermatophagoides pteronyssinus TaxID=6956 RepID=A0ABQ8ISC9_DERPT|nr:hypothetical protein DERP_006914 [Dermatophagoides pteronyssinus]
MIDFAHHSYLLLLFDEVINESLQLITTCPISICSRTPVRSISKRPHSILDLLPKCFNNFLYVSPINTASRPTLRLLKYCISTANLTFSVDTKRIRAFGGIFGREHDPITIDELLIFSNNDNESDDDDNNDSYLCICNKIIIIEKLKSQNGNLYDDDGSDFKVLFYSTTTTTYSKKSDFHNS